VGWGKGDYSFFSSFGPAVQKNRWGFPAGGQKGMGSGGRNFCPPSGGRKRWAGFNPQNPLDFAQNGFGFRPISTTILN